MLSPPLRDSSKPIDVSDDTSQSKQLFQELITVPHTGTEPWLRPTKEKDVGIPELDEGKVEPFVPKLGPPDYDKEKFEGRQLEDREMSLNILSEHPNVADSATSITPVGPGGTTTPAIAQSGVSSVLPSLVLRITLIVPWFVLPFRLRRSSLSSIDQARICSGRTSFSD